MNQRTMAIWNQNIKKQKKTKKNNNNKQTKKQNNYKQANDGPDNGA